MRPARKLSPECSRVGGARLLWGALFLWAGCSEQLGHRPPGGCGDGELGEDEQCEGASLRGATCAELGFSGGVLRCTEACVLDSAGCTCDPGLELAMGGDGCVDSDECLLDNGGCGQLLCVNSPGAFACRDACQLDNGGCGQLLCQNNKTATPTCIELVGVAADIYQMGAGTWYQIAGSAFADAEVFIDRGGNSSIFSYSEGVFDPTRNRLAVWGGGHADSSDNGIYGFNLDVAGEANDYRWIVIEPRSNSAHRSACYSCEYDCSGGYLEDGAPIANHTQSFLEYHPGWDAMISPLQGSVSTTGDCYTSAAHLNFNRYDFDSSSWTTGLASLSGLTTRYFGTVVVDSSNNVWVFNTDSDPHRKIFEYQYASGTWIERAANSGAYGWEVFSAIDPARNIAVLTGNGHFKVWDLSDETSPRLLAEESTGPEDLVDAKAASLAWDPTTGLFVGWVGGAAAEEKVFALRVDEGAGVYHFMEVAASVDNTISPPTRAAPRGPLGRWAYSPEENVFVMAYGLDVPVLIYKLSGATADSDLPSVEFSVPASSGSLEVPITSLGATDRTSAIVGYQVTTTLTPPAPWTAAWGAAPEVFTVSAPGSWQLHAWAMDAHGNVSPPALASVEVSL